MNGRWKSESEDSWTAVSKVPYLKAVEMWTKGDCWHGGDLLEYNRRYCLKDGYGHKSFLNSKSLSCRKEFDQNMEGNAQAYTMSNYSVMSGNSSREVESVRTAV